ncbi:hypothetical protein C8R44DRAFT_601310 [Mycena epipterygia]|nr:hypothetical protein C8R44DRAFT_601310 [Mycena epipterygia]
MAANYLFYLVNAILSKTLAAVAAPVRVSDNDANSQGAQNIVSNFQDISPVLSLLASDSVEDKLTDPRATIMERASTVWSLFGMIGAVQAFLKISVGLSHAEAAGVNLHGGGVYTMCKTRGAHSAFVVGDPKTRVGPQFWWQDNSRQLLGELEVNNSPWTRPHVLVVGYSHCPLRGRRAVKEAADFIFWALLTTVFVCAPLIALRLDELDGFYWDVTLGMAGLTGIVAGCVLPALLHALNLVGVALLRDIDESRFGKPGQGVVCAPDTVSSVRADSRSTIMWQVPGEHLYIRSGDRWYIRVLAMFATAIIIVYYIFNYLLLGAVSSRLSYTWLGVQVVILAFRFVMWAIRPSFFVGRGLSVLYIVTGSLVPALDPDPKCDPPARMLAEEVVHFAVASAGSRELNSGRGVGRLQFSALNRLSGVAPADILRAPYCDMAEVWLRIPAKELRVVRLGWGFVEELYTAQGLVLGNNPWALGGLYLAAVLRGAEFVGLTTVHPVMPCGEEDSRRQAPQVLEIDGASIISGYPPNAKGAVLGGVVIDSLIDGQVIGKYRSAETSRFDHWHDKFRENVAKCRAAAVANGPSHCEVHVQNMGDGPSGKKNMVRTEPELTDVLEYVHDVVKKERIKDHERCGAFCIIFAF